MTLPHFSNNSNTGDHHVIYAKKNGYFYKESREKRKTYQIKQLSIIIIL